MPFSIEGINTESLFSFLDKLCLIVVIISIPIIVDIIYYQYFMANFFFNFNTLVIIINYFVFYGISSYLKKWITKHYVSKFLEKFCAINIKISSFLHSINQDIIYINVIDNNTILIYYIISALELLCILNIFLVIFLFNQYFDNLPGNKLENNNCLCPICMKSNNNWILPCNHAFHKNCISEWLKIKNNCPLCRKSFD